MARSYRPGTRPSRDERTCVSLIPGPNYDADIHAQQEANHVRRLIPSLVLGAAVLFPAAAPAQAGHAKVKIVAPANGATVSSPVKVVLQATGVGIVPATVEPSGTGHHHLFLRPDPPALDAQIPRRGDRIPPL